MFGDLCREVESYYTARVTAHGPTPAGVDWNSAGSQELRFRQLLRLRPAGGSFSLLDYGCGYGALHGWLKLEGIACDYRGYDLSAEMIRTARQVNGEGPSCRFGSAVSDLVPADLAVASGIFNVKLRTPTTTWTDYVLDTIGCLDRLSRLGFGFNLLTSYADRDRMRPDLYYGDPCFFFDHCKKRYGRNVALLHDYDLYEFTILVRKGG
jgi:SAM-dependent methyltransferase